MANYQKIKGTQDFFGLEALKKKTLEAKIRVVAENFGFQEIMTPIFEYTEVFTRSVGDESDIVSKEMYTFLDRGDRSITLRPEGTASIARAFNENKLYGNGNQLNKYYYCGPMFRYERPQAGRYRQFHQFGVEAIGNSSPLLDCDVIMSAYRIFETLNIKNIVLKINSIGDFASRSAYQTALQTYFKDKLDDLCGDCHRRYSKNPMRILDCKADKNNPVLLNAPKIKDYLNETSQEYFKIILSILDCFNIKYVVDPNLVRGLDYYTDTVFEYIIQSDDELNGLAICAGGKYAGLVRELGGPDLPGIGYAFGLERITSLLNNQEAWGNLELGVDVFVIGLDPESKQFGLQLAHEWRMGGLKVELDYQSNILKTQFKTLERFNPSYIVIIGEEERISNTVTLKNNTTKEQQRVAVDKVMAIVKEKK